MRSVVAAAATTLVALKPCRNSRPSKCEASVTEPPPTTPCPNDAKLGFRVFERQYSDQPLVPVSLNDLLDDLDSPDLRLVYFGEEHGNQVSHKLEKLVYEHLTHKRDRRWTLSLEMLSTDVQDRVDKFLRGEVTVDEVCLSACLPVG